MKKSTFFSIMYILGLRNALLPIMACIIPVASIDLFIPRHQIQFILTAFFVGLLIAKLMATLGFTYKLGNRKTLLTVLPISILGVLLCFLPLFVFLILGCFLQGVGIGMTASICTDLARIKKDLSYAQTWSRLNQIPTWSPFFVALICGLLLHYMQWQSCLVLALIIIVAGWFLVYAFIPDTDIEELEETYTTLEVIKQLFKSQVLFCNLTICSLIISVKAIFYTTAPFILTKDLGISSKYFFIFVFMFILGSFLGLKLSSILEKFMQHKTIILVSCYLAFVSSVLFLAIDLINLLNVYSIMSIFFLLAISMRLMMPSIRSYVADKFGKYVAIATAFISVVVSLAAAVLSGSSAYLVKEDIENLSFLFIGLSLTAFIIAQILFFSKEHLKWKRDI
jgi:MFS family permease